MGSTFSTTQGIAVEQFYKKKGKNISVVIQSINPKPANFFALKMSSAVYVCCIYSNALQTTLELQWLEQAWDHKIILTKGDSSQPGWSMPKMTSRDHDVSSSQPRWMNHEVLLYIFLMEVNNRTLIRQSDLGSYCLQFRQPKNIGRWGEQTKKSM